MTDGSLIMVPLWFRIISLLLFLYRIKLFKVFQVSLELYEHPNQKNIYDAALALIAIMYGSMQGIIAVASLLATKHNPGNGIDPQ